MRENEDGPHEPGPDGESDPPSRDDPLDEEFGVCAYCGMTLPKEEWCPMVTDADADGELVVRSFCDDACKEAWIEDDS